MTRPFSTRLAILMVLLLLAVVADIITRPIEAQGQRGTPNGKGYVLQAGEGESLMGGNVLVKVSPRTGSKRMMVGMQRMLPKMQVPEHTHRVEEVVVVIRGS